MIVRKGKLVESILPAADFRVKVIYVTSELVVLSTPLSNYGMKGQLALFLNPIMKLDPDNGNCAARISRWWNQDWRRPATTSAATC